MARDPDTIQQEIEKARDALAESLDVLSERASPKRFVDQGRASLQQRARRPEDQVRPHRARRAHRARGVAQALPLTTGGGAPASTGGRARSAARRACGTAPAAAAPSRAVLQQGAVARDEARRAEARDGHQPSVGEHAHHRAAHARRPRGRRRAAAAACRRVPACRSSWIFSPNWSDQKYGTRGGGGGSPRMSRATVAAWSPALVQCSWRCRSPCTGSSHAATSPTAHTPGSPRPARSDRTRPWWSHAQPGGPSTQSRHAADPEPVAAAACPADPDDRGVAREPRPSRARRPCHRPSPASTNP